MDNYVGFRFGGRHISFFSAGIGNGRTFSFRGLIFQLIWKHIGLLKEPKRPQRRLIFGSDKW